MTSFILHPAPFSFHQAPPQVTDLRGQLIDPKDEERKVACFPGPRGSLGTLGTYGERSGLQEP